MRTPIRVATALLLATGIAVMVPQTAHADEIRDAQWYLNALHVTDSHQVSMGQGTRIGVIDSGINAEHPDLTGAVQPGKAFGSGGDSVTDQNDHGTGVAAVLAGRGHGTDGADGIVGIAPEAEIVSVGLGIEPGETAQAEELVSTAIKALIDAKVDVIAVTAELQLPPDMPAIQNPAAAAQIPLVAASGTPIENAVTVVGTEMDGKPWDGTPPLPGETSYVVAAPAVNIPVATADGDYAEPRSDVSYSAAIVAGVLAQMSARWPDAPADVLEEHLTTEGTTGVGAGGYDEQLGSGIVDPQKVLNSDIAGQNAVDPNDLPAEPDDTAAADDPAGNDNGMLAAIIGIAGLIALAVLVISVRAYDAKLHRRHRAGGTPANPPAGHSGSVPVAGHTGNLPPASQSGGIVPAGPSGQVPASQSGGIAPAGPSGQVPASHSGSIPPAGHTGNVAATTAQRGVYRSNNTPPGGVPAPGDTPPQPPRPY